MELPFWSALQRTLQTLKRVAKEAQEDKHFTIGDSMLWQGLMAHG